MRKTLLVLLAAVALGLWVAGCGGGGTVAAPQGKVAAPFDAGDPSQIAEGVTYLEDKLIYLVKERVNSENRIWALYAMRGTDMLTYDPEKKEFHNAKNIRTYDINGNALFKITKGAKTGQEGLPMDLKKIEKNKTNGHIKVYTRGWLSGADRTNPQKGAYVVVP